MTQDSSLRIPQHIAIIMDGNNRWAKARLLGGITGHKAGVDAVRATVRGCASRGVQALTLFAFSSENWKRPEEEVRGLMDLFLWALDKEVKRLVEHNIRLRVIGDLSPLPQDLQDRIAQSCEMTANNTGMWLVVAVNYGGRWDIAQASRALAQQVQQGLITLDQVDEQRLAQSMCLADLPAVDLCIRTANEQRLSNFLLWQLAYAELWFTPCLWPDFREAQLEQAIQAFNGRERRFGGRD